MKDLTETETGHTLEHDIANVTTDKQKSYHYVCRRAEGPRQAYYKMSWSPIAYADSACIAFIIHDETAMVEVSRGKEAEHYTKRLVASITHDLRTPLNGIMGIIEALDEFIQPEGKHLLKLATNTCTLMLYLINDVLDLAQIEANTLSLKRALYSPKEIIDETVQLMQFNYNQKHLGLAVKYASNVPREINSDKVRYRQILLNLLGNALKFTSEGHVSVEVCYDPKSDMLVTRVADTGSGIAHEDFSKLFQLFGKISSTDKINPSGVGLGLHMCKNLSIQMEGNIFVESEWGKGAAFTFYVACGLSEADLKAPTEEYIRSFMIFAKCRDNEETKGDDTGTIKLEITTDTHQVPPTKKCEMFTDLTRVEKEFLRTHLDTNPSCNCPKVLLVDDSELNLVVLKNYLSKTKCKADVAYNGQEAVAKVMERATSTSCKKYNVIYMDINMPVMNGIEAAERLKKLAQETIIHATPVIALSAGSAGEQGCSTVFEEVLNKPINKATFLQSVGKYCVL